MRSAARKLKRRDKLTLPAPTPGPTYRSNSLMDTNVSGADSMIVPRTVEAGKVSGITIDRSLMIDGWRGNGVTQSSLGAIYARASRLISAT